MKKLQILLRQRHLQEEILKYLESVSRYILIWTIDMKHGVGKMITEDSDVYEIPTFRKKWEWNHDCCEQLKRIIPLKKAPLQMVMFGSIEILHWLKNYYRKNVIYKNLNAYSTTPFYNWKFYERMLKNVLNMEDKYIIDNYPMIMITCKWMIINMVSEKVMQTNTEFGFKIMSEFHAGKHIEVLKYANYAKILELLASSDAFSYPYSTRNRYEFFIELRQWIMARQQSIDFTKIPLDKYPNSLIQYPELRGKVVWKIS